MGVDVVQIRRRGELAERKIRINSIAPDMVPTPGDEGLGNDSGAILDAQPHVRHGGRVDAAPRLTA